MTPATRASREKSWQHILKEILSAPAIQEAFVFWEIDDPTEMTRLSVDHLEYPYKDKNENKLYLSRKNINQVHDCILWYAQVKERTMESWLLLNEDVFFEFRESLLVPETLHNDNQVQEDEAAAAATAAAIKVAADKAEKDRADMIAAAVAAARAAAPSSEKETKKHRFNLATNRHKASEIKQLQSAVQWQDWHSKFISITKMHGTFKVLDPDYKAETEEDKEELKDLNAFLYHCLSECVTILDGKMLVNKFRDATNSLAVYQGLVSLYSTGEAGIRRANKIEGDLDTIKLDGSWTKGAYAFLLHWQGLEMELSKYRPDGMTTEKRYTLLRRAVSTHPKLQVAIENYDQLKRLSTLTLT
jgi:hypothetical protein